MKHILTALETLGFFAMLIGGNGILGYLEFGTGLVQSIALFVVGAIVLTASVKYEKGFYFDD